jgi:hypothetical protein
MRYSAALPFALLASWTTYNNSFTIYGVQSFKKTALSAWSSDPPPPPIKPDLVDQGTFVSAIETLQREIATANGVDYVKEEDPKFSYAIGRLVVSLPIETMPGLDLTETPELVLVTAVSGNVAETGIQPLDTIVGVSAGDTFQESTKALNLDETAAILTDAINRALDNGMTEIEFELNRLIKGYYG